MKQASLHFLTFLLLLISIPAGANDGTYYTKGNQLVPLQETRISVRREVLTISLMDNGYARVDVQYEFWNPEQTTCRLLMGFEADPPYNYDYKFYPDGVHPSISDFTVEMNGRVLTYSNAACRADTSAMVRIDTTKSYFVFDDKLYVNDGKGTMNDGVYKTGIPFSYVYYFYADFQPGLNRVHHSYIYKMSTAVWSPYVVDYKLTPAARWAGGKIDDFTLVLRVDSTAKHFFVFDSAFGRVPFTVIEGMGKTRRPEHYGNLEVSLRNGAIMLHKTDFSPQQSSVFTQWGVKAYTSTIPVL